MAELPAAMDAEVMRGAELIAKAIAPAPIRATIRCGAILIVVPYFCLAPIWI
jgi:hypothetical protein